MILMTITLILLLTYAVIITDRAWHLTRRLIENEELNDEYINVITDALRSLQRAHNAIDVVSKHPLAENDPEVQRLAKTINSARDELQLTLSRYTIEE